MPWGTHKGIPIGQVDANYLLWLFRQVWIKTWPDIHDYLLAHQAALTLAERKETAEPQGEFTSYDDYMRYGRD